MSDTAKPHESKEAQIESQATEEPQQTQETHGRAANRDVTGTDSDNGKSKSDLVETQDKDEKGQESTMKRRLCFGARNDRCYAAGATCTCYGWQGRRCTTDCGCFCPSVFGYP